jgi:hypothetical protein
VLVWAHSRQETHLRAAARDPLTQQAVVCDALPRHQQRDALQLLEQILVLVSERHLRFDAGASEENDSF